MTTVMQRICLAASLSLLLAGTALAQFPPQTPQNVSPTACADSGGSSGDLSNKLSQSNGVICPPDVDPAMKAPTPNAGKMPVIPPPGSPGGSQNVQPK